MVRFIPTLVGFLVLVIAFAVSSGILTVIGGALVAAGVLWFVATGTATKPDRG